jgi:hypothetical protein
VALIEPMGVFLTGGYDPPPGPGLTIVENLEILVEEFGSRRAAGRALGVAESTLRGWMKGVKPRLPAATIAAMARGAAASQRWQAAYSGAAEMHIEAWVTVSGDTRRRKLHVGRLISRPKMQGILRAWAALDDTRAERLLMRAIDTDYQPFAWGQVIDVWFGEEWGH